MSLFKPPSKLLHKVLFKDVLTHDGLRFKVVSKIKSLYGAHVVKSGDGKIFVKSIMLLEMLSAMKNDKYITAIEHNSIRNKVIELFPFTLIEITE